MLKRLRHVGAGQPVVPVSALDLQRDQASGKELRQMGARRLRDDSRRVGQLARREGTTGKARKLR